MTLYALIFLFIFTVSLMIATSMRFLKLEERIIDLEQWQWRSRQSEKSKMFGGTLPKWIEENREKI